MRGLNKVTLIGNLSKAPEVQVLASNVPVAKFSLATSETYRDEAGQPHTSTDWHAELAQAHLRKGSLVYLEGKLKTHHYDDAAGQRHYVTEIIGEHLLMLDKKPADH